MYVPDNTREVVFSETEMDKADYEGPNSIGASIIMHWLLLGEERIQECHARVRSASSFPIFLSTTACRAWNGPASRDPTEHTHETDPLLA